MKNTVLILLVLTLAVLAGCNAETTAEEPIPSAEVPEEHAAEPEHTINDFEGCVEAGNPVMESYPRQCRAGNEIFVEEIDDPMTFTEEDHEKEQGPFCGDDVCGIDEDCHGCPEDCGCKDEERCYDGECIIIACGRDYECNDDDPCTKDICQFPEHPNAFCDHENIERCEHGDDCCPAECSSENDDDCDPVCGNDICEEDEDYEGCPEDCVFV